MYVVSFIVALYKTNFLILYRFVEWLFHVSVFQALLTMLVNKLGDPDHKLAAHTAHLLTRLGKLSVIIVLIIVHLPGYFFEVTFNCWWQLA